MHTLASPARFMRVSGRVMPWLSAAAALMLGVGLVQALFFSPADYQQGEAVRIMYIHVPAAWMSLMIYSLMAAASGSYLVWKHPLADITARESALPGAAMTLITLVTGSLWGKPMWGAWWVWDARLTSVLVLFFLYLGYLALASAMAHEERGRRACAVLALVGFINIPIIKFSVEWWNTLHQPASLLKSGGPAVDGSMLMPLLLMIGGCMCLSGVIIVLRVRAALIQQKIRRLQFIGR
jgi:heme exporter protein C